MESYPRFFARFKIILDPMFPKLADFVKKPDTVMDIGTGYGIPAVWLLELYPHARIFGIEPDQKRVRIASRALGAQGTIEIGKAPDIPTVPGMADTALMLDMIHLLTDDEFMLTLQRVHGKLRPGGSLIMRTTVPSDTRFSWKRWIETKRIRMQNGIPHYRTKEQVLANNRESGL